MFFDPSPTDEYSWERGTFVITAQPIYRRADDVLVEKPPRPIVDSGEAQWGDILSTITTGSTSLATDRTTASHNSASVSVTDTKSATRTAATLTSDKSISSNTRSIASATPTRTPVHTSQYLATSRKTADASVTPASIEQATSPNDASVTPASIKQATSPNDAAVPARSQELDTINTTTKQTTEPTFSSRTSNLQFTTSSPSPSSSTTPPSTAATPTPTRPPTTTNKTPIVIGVGVGIGIAVALTILGVILIILKRRRSRIARPRERASLPRYVDGKKELDAGIEQLAPQEIGGVEIGGPQELMTCYNVPEMGSERDAPQELMT